MAKKKFYMDSNGNEIQEEEYDGRVKGNKTKEQVIREHKTNTANSAVKNAVYKEDYDALKTDFEKKRDNALSGLNDISRNPAKYGKAGVKLADELRKDWDFYESKVKEVDSKSKKASYKPKSEFEKAVALTRMNSAAGEWVNPTKRKTQEEKLMAVDSAVRSLQGPRKLTLEDYARAMYDIDKYAPETDAYFKYNTTPHKYGFMNEATQNKYYSAMDKYGKIATESGASDMYRSTGRGILDPYEMINAYYYSRKGDKYIEGMIPTELTQMTEGETKLYMTLHNHSEKDANDFLAELRPILEERATQKEQEEIREKVKRGGADAFAEQIKSIGRNVVYAPFAAAEAVTENVGDMLFNDDSDGYNSAIQRQLYNAQAARDALVEGWHPIFGSIYKGGMSILDSTVGSLMGIGLADPTAGKMANGILKSAGSLNMASGAMAQQMQDAHMRGLSSGKQLAEGITAGVMAAITEKIGIDRLFSKKSGGFLKNFIKGGASETLEEGAEWLVNTGADYAIAGEKSNIAQNGIKNSLKEFGLEAIGAFVSGGMASGIGGGVSNTYHNSYLKKVGSLYAGKSDLLIDLGVEAAENSSHKQIGQAVEEAIAKGLEKDGSMESIAKTIGLLEGRQKGSTLSDDDMRAASAVASYILHGESEASLAAAGNSGSAYLIIDAIADNDNVKNSVKEAFSPEKIGAEMRQNEAVQSLIDTGLESPRMSLSHALALTAEGKGIDSLSNKEIGELYLANLKQVAKEGSVQWQTNNEYMRNAGKNLLKNPDAMQRVLGLAGQMRNDSDGRAMLAPTTEAESIMQKMKDGRQVTADDARFLVESVAVNTAKNGDLVGMVKLIDALDGGNTDSIGAVKAVMNIANNKGSDADYAVIRKSSGAVTVLSAVNAYAEQMRSNPSERTSNARPYNKGGYIVEDGESEAFRKKNPEGYKVIEQMAKDLGKAVKFVDGLYAEDGTPLDGVINSQGVFINTQSENPVRFAVTHEFSHRMKKAASKQWEKYQKYVIDRLKNTPTKTEGVSEYDRRYELKKGHYAENEIDEEIACDFVGSDLINNVDELRALIRHDNSLAQIIRKLWNWVCEHLGLNVEKEKATQLWTSAYNKSARNVKKGKVGEYSREGKKSFAGVRAKTSNVDALNSAQKMEREGKTAEEIWQKTGWGRGLDGKWRFEINDFESYLTEKPDLELHRSEEGDYYTGKLEDIFNHKKLFESYPPLKETKIIIQEKEPGVYATTFANRNEIVLSKTLFERTTDEYKDLLNNRQKYIDEIERTPEYKKYDSIYKMEDGEISLKEWLRLEAEARKNFFETDLGKRYYSLRWGKDNVRKYELGWSDKAKEVLLHEIQHLIQYEEGFAKGSNPSYWKGKNNTNRDASDLYESTAGEIEARDVQERRDMTEEERRNTYPESFRMNDNVVFADTMDFGKLSENAEGEAQSGNQIMVNMNEHERAEILKKTSLDVVEAKSDALKLSLEEVEVLESRCKSKAEKVLKYLCNKFGLFRNYNNENIEFSFNYSGNSLSESAHQQNERNPNFMDFAAMLTVFDSVVSNAQPFEIHTDKYVNTRREDPNLKYDYVLLSAFRRGDFIIPVEINIKEFLDDKISKMHMTVTLKKIRADILALTPNNDSTRSTPPALNISIAELIKNVNPSDGDFLRYAPDEMLDEAQIESKNKALEKNKQKIEGLKKSIAGTRPSDATGAEVLRDAQNDNVRGVDIEKLQAENAELRKQIENMSLQLNLDNSSGKTLDTAEVKRVAEKIRKTYGSKIGPSKLHRELTKLYTLMRGGNAAADEVSQKISEIADEVINKATITVANEEYSELLDQIKTARIHVPESERTSFRDGYEYFRKHYAMGKITLANDGIELDVLWRKLCNEYPALFDESMHGSEERLERILEIREDFSPREVSAFESETEKKAAHLKLKSDIKEMFFEIPESDSGNRYVFYDKRAAVAEKKLEEAKREHNRVLEKTEKKFESKLEKTEKMYEHEIDRIENRHSRETSKIQQEADKAVERAEEKAIKMRDKYDRDKVSGSIERVFGFLFTMAENPTDARHIPEKLKRDVKGFVNRFVYDTKIVGKIDPKEKKVLVSVKLDNIGTAYKTILRSAWESDLENSPLLDEKLTEAFGEFMEEIPEDPSGNFKRLEDMTTRELAVISDMLTGIHHAITQSNKLFSENIKATKSEASDNVCREMNAVRDKRKGSGEKWVYHGEGGKLYAGYNRMNQFVTSDMLQPWDMFHRVGGTMEKLYGEAREAFDEHIMNLKTTKEVIRKAVGKLDIKEMTGKGSKDYTFKLLGGGIIKLYKGQILSLYALYKRPQGRQHIESGGIVTERLMWDENGHKTGGVAPLSHHDLGKIFEVLSDKEIQMVDEVVKFMSETCAKWGNEASMKLLGFEKYGEGWYFPITVWEGSVNKEGKKKGDRKLTGQTFTKELVKDAGNAIVVKDFFDTVLDHIVGMSLYNTVALPILDIERVLNHTTEKSSVRQARAAIEKTYGSNVTNYIYNWMTDVNGSKQMVREDITDVLLRNATKNNIAFKLSVLMKQGTSIVRACQVINPQHILASLDGVIHPKKTVAQMQEHIPIAYYKGLGFRNPYTSRDIKTSILDMEPLSDKAAFGGYGKVDDFTWGVIFTAVKSEIESDIKKNKLGIEIESELYWKKVSERFNYVIDRTQVVDSVFHRSQIMRSNNPITKIFTLYMSESIKSLNMYRTELQDGVRNKTKLKSFSRTTAVWLASAVLLAAVAAFPKTLKDELEDYYDGDGKRIGFWKRYLGNLYDGVFDELNLAKMVPYLKTAVSITEGWSQKDITWQNVEKAITQTKSAFNGNGKVWYRNVYNLADAVSSVFGQPYGNALKEVETISRTLVHQLGDEYYTDYLIAKSTWDIKNTDNKSKFMKYYNMALKNGDADAAEKILNDYMAETFEVKNLKNNQTKKVIGDMSELYGKADKKEKSKLLYSVPDEKFSNDGNEYKFSGKEYEEYVGDSYNTLWELAEKFVESKEYKKLTDENKIRSFGELKSYALHAERADRIEDYKLEGWMEKVYNGEMTYAESVAERAAERDRQAAREEWKSGFEYDETKYTSDEVNVIESVAGDAASYYAAVEKGIKYDEKDLRHVKVFDDKLDGVMSIEDYAGHRAKAKKTAAMDDGKPNMKRDELVAYLETTGYPRQVKSALFEAIGNSNWKNPYGVYSAEQVQAVGKTTPPSAKADTSPYTGESYKQGKTNPSGKRNPSGSSSHLPLGKGGSDGGAKRSNTISSVSTGINYVAEAVAKAIPDKSQIMQVIDGMDVSEAMRKALYAAFGVY